MNVQKRLPHNLFRLSRNHFDLRRLETTSVRCSLQTFSVARTQMSRRTNSFRPGSVCTDQTSVFRLLFGHSHVYLRPTIVFFDTGADYDSVERSALCICVLKSGVLNKYLSFLKAHYLQTADRIRKYGQVSSFFAISISVCQECTVAGFFVIWKDDGSHSV